MPITILDLEYTRLPAQMDGFEHYDGAMALIRMRGRPVGFQYLEVRNGRIETHGLSLPEYLAILIRWPLWQAWLNDEFELEPVPDSSILREFSIVVCTRDHPEDLRKCLASLMDLPDDGQEILVVDNAPSNDNTSRVVADFPGIRYVREDRIGLARARNCGIRAARGEYIAFTDDDAVVDPGWLRALARSFHDPMVLCVTGQALPFEQNTPAQEWFERYSTFVRGFKPLVFDGLTHDSHRANDPGAGVSMALRRSVLQLIGPFDEAFGPGMPTRAGTDTEMFARILRAGYRIAYEPEALVWHRHRQDWDVMLRRLWEYGSGTCARWTRELLLHGDSGGFVLGLYWVTQFIIPQIIMSLLRRPGSIPLALQIELLRGMIRGPLGYLEARRKLREDDHIANRNS